MKNPTKKLPKGVTSEFIDSIAGLSIDALKARIVEIQLQNEENELFKESDAYINAKAEFDTAKERYQLVVGPVRETTTTLKNKTKLIIERLKEKGGA